MWQSVLLTLREGFEASLIVGIISGVIKRDENISRKERSHYLRIIFGAVATAVAVSVAAGTGFFILFGGFSGRSEKIFEGVAMMAAALVITHVWRKTKHSAGIYAIKTERSLASENISLALFFAVFWAVMIEGIEIVLFFLASPDTANFLIGGSIGLALAVVAGFLLYQLNRLRDARIFFMIVGPILVLVSAGLMAHGLHEFQEAFGAPILKEEIWNINHLPVIGEDAGLGKFMKSIFGYNGNPELLELMVWAGWLTFATWVTGTHKLFARKRTI